MLPRSCLRLADSKSNSSTRLPRRTTTRVSSGWVASMSILLGIDQSHERRRPGGRPAPPFRRVQATRGGARLIVVERMGRAGARAHRIVRTGVAPRRGSVGMANGLALDQRSQHEFRPVRDGSAWAPPLFPSLTNLD